MTTPELPRLEELEQGAVAGPTPMRRAHREGLRKSVGRCKAWFKPQIDCETALRTVLLTYLREWDTVYGEGVEALGLTNTERITLVIRQDTVKQIIRELGV